MKPKKIRRFGIVKFGFEYIVDLDDKDMIAHAKQAIECDITNASMSDKIHNWIRVIEAPNAREKDILEFLKIKE